MTERRTTPETGDGRTRLELYVRSLSPAGARSRQDAVIERLAALTEREVIAGYEVRVWGSGIRPASPTARTPSGTLALEHLGAFEDWAAHNGLTLGSGFRTTEVHSVLTGETYTERTFPVLTLAQFRGPTLQRVAPCADGDTTYSVEDCLEAIDGGRAFVGQTDLRPYPVGRDHRETTTADGEDDRRPLATPGSADE